MSDLEIKVEQSLETLHKALANLEPAITHVQSVLEASNAAKTVINENIKFLNSQKSINEEYKKELINSFNEKVDTISNKSNEVLNDVKKTSNNLLNKNIDFLKDQKNISKKHKIELINSFGEKVDVISNKSNDVLDGLKSSVVDIIALDNSLNNYLENIKKIDFPTRLTSIDTDISSLSSRLNNMLGTVNNIQNEIIRFERENKYDIKSLSISVRKGNEVLLENLATISKENKTLKVLVVITAIISLVAVITNFIN
jgi:hypothetical protein